MLIRLLSILGSSASLVGLILMFHPTGQGFSVLESILLGTGVVLTANAIALELKDHFARRPRILRTKLQIREYMFHWIANGGKVCIFSNDLSWVDDDEMVQLLKTKAQRDELQICIPAIIPIAEMLKEAGADILTYSQLNVIPQSRFTIVNVGRMDAQVAVGRRLDGVHVVEEFGAGDHPIFAVVTDLVGIITRFNQAQRNL